jgi:hypothetical protein
MLRTSCVANVTPPRAAYTSAIIANSCSNKDMRHFVPIGTNLARSTLHFSRRSNHEFRIIVLTCN